MAEPPRRKRLQVHLSTALVLMFAAGGLIWANVTEHASIHTSGYGWPFTWITYYFMIDDSGRWIDFGPAIIDLGVALAILFAVWFVCEGSIRWRAGRKKG